ncbi:acyl-CoA carboxylase subunit epsilon [Nonomuraea sp. MG754425]|uniref:acyl-CoA carboxylase subunit epsilon n=1 Tax=Nonomuraea sp. MG754425 TaxID=2570319 RepID=UPI001F47EAC7|nr:acyl-CoA carboxylase subunit epsilon [Nonomuraea sp. MG754425]MCF6474908.1 acyl-CoA carboxylase subunit epsilon [Nonomuraea sp. MG754425]
MELTVVRGQATPEDLQAIIAAVVRRVAEAARNESSAWSDPSGHVRRPLPSGGHDGWRLGVWAS